jgi:hypothetical protein
MMADGGQNLTEDSQKTPNGSERTGARGKRVAEHATLKNLAQGNKRVAGQRNTAERPKNIGNG